MLLGTEQVTLETSCCGTMERSSERTWEKMEFKVKMNIRMVVDIIQNFNMICQRYGMKKEDLKLMERYK